MIRSLLIPTICIWRGGSPTLVLTDVNGEVSQVAQDEIPIDTYHMHRERGSSKLVLKDVNGEVAQVAQDKIPIDTYHMHRERGISNAGSDGCEWGSCPGCAG
jgi:hypothetical protein